MPSIKIITTICYKNQLKLLLILVSIITATTILQAQKSPDLNLVFVCNADNDFYQVVKKNLGDLPRYNDLSDALNQADRGAGVLILADEYPEETNSINRELFSQAANKDLRLYIEFPDYLPGFNINNPESIQYERGIITGNFGPALPSMSLVYVHGCNYVPVSPKNGKEQSESWIVLAKVAGYNKAVYGLEGTTSYPLLFPHENGRALIATTKISQFKTGRYAPYESWQHILDRILEYVQPGKDIPLMEWEEEVRPAYQQGQEPASSATRNALHEGAAWFFNSRMLIDGSWRDQYKKGGEIVRPMPDLQWEPGAGNHGILEAFHSEVRADGTQLVRWQRRADCTGEVSGALALAGKVLENEKYQKVGKNLGSWLVDQSIMTGGNRADPAHPSYGLISWNDAPSAGQGIFYGDDNARCLLGLINAAGAMDYHEWDETIMKAVLANFRTTGVNGFRGHRIEEEDLEEKGWQHYYNREILDIHPHYEAYLWAIYLWAYRETDYQPFYERAKSAIRITMEGYPGQWKWTNGIQQERARMLLPLAWLVQLEDTEQHRKWLRIVADDLLEAQTPVGAIREELGGPEKGSYGPPQTNEAYGTGEAALIHENGDPCVDLLYTSNFALVGLHEAAAATGSRRYQKAVDRLADFIIKIQVESDAHPELDGVWFRAFDYRKWDYWGSNADIGWGVWATETGWTQGEILSTLAVRELGTSMWDLSRNSKVENYFPELLDQMIN